jgi:hypothetical protein
MATAPAAAAMTAVNATDAAPVELAPVAWAPMDMARACCVLLVIGATLNDEPSGLAGKIARL